MERHYYQIQDVSAITEKYRRGAEKYQILTSSHANDTLFSEWLSKFLDQQKRIQNGYWDLPRAITDYVSYYSILNELGSESFFTALKQEEEYSTPIPQLENSQKQFVVANTPVLKRGLLASDQHENQVWIRECYEENPDGTRQMIQNVYHSFIVDREFQEESIIHLLDLLREFDYEEMVPVGLIILSSSLSLDSRKIKNKVLDVFDHWPNRSTYHLLKKLTPPGDFLTQIKYKSILNSYEKRYGIPAQD